MIEYLIKIYYVLLYTQLTNPLIVGWVLITEKASANLWGEYTWQEKYWNYILYLLRKSRGEKITYTMVQIEYLMDCQRRFKKAIKEHENNKNN